MATQIEFREMPDWRRHDVVKLLEGNANMGVELGVAEGVFSERMMASGRFAHFFGVDMYADTHDVRQYKRTLRRLGMTSGYKLLRMRFDEALDLFDDDSLDFVYVDGYAHSGEEGGETIFDWFKKVKVGGVIAGDDYHSDWPLVCEAVREFALQVAEPVILTTITEAENQYSRYPTWAIRKTHNADLVAPLELVHRGKSEAARVARKQEGGLIRRSVRRMLPSPVIAWLKRMRADH